MPTSDPASFTHAAAIADALDVSNADKMQQIHDMFVAGKLTKSDMNSLADRALKPSSAAWQNIASQIDHMTKLTTAEQTASGMNAPWSMQQAMVAQQMLSAVKTKAAQENWTPTQIMGEFDKIKGLLNQQSIEQAINDNFTWSTGGFFGIGARQDVYQEQVADVLNRIAKGGEQRTLLATPNMLSMVANAAKRWVASKNNISNPDTLSAQVTADGVVYVTGPDGRQFMVKPNKDNKLDVLEGTKQ